MWPSGRGFTSQCRLDSVRSEPSRLGGGIWHKWSNIGSRGYNKNYGFCADTGKSDVLWAQPWSFRERFAAGDDDAYGAVFSVRDGYDDVHTAGERIFRIARPFRYRFVDHAAEEELRLV